MPVSVTMPALGESVTEGTVTRWLKQEGERVEADEPLLEVSTDKVDTEIPSPAAGVLSRIVVAEDETVGVGSELAVISGDNESADDAPAAPVAVPSAEAETEASAPEPEPAAAATEAPAPVAAQAAAPAQEQTSGGESTAVRMPALGESVTEGTVTRWLKQVGDTVEADEALLEVSTDKVDTEIPSPVAGTLLEIKVAEDETVPVGADLAVIGVAGGAAPAAPATPAPTASPAPAAPAAAPTPPPAPAPVAAAPAPTPTPAPAPAPAAAPAPTPAPAQPIDGDDAAYVTPLVRKLATEHGVSLGSLTGTGVGGRIRKQDVLAAAEAKAAAAKATAAPAPAAAPAAAASAPAAAPAAISPLRGRTEKLTRMRVADREADGRVAAGVGAAHDGRRGRRHEDRPAPRHGEGRLRRPPRCEAVVPAVLRPRGRRGAAGPPQRQLLDRPRRRHGHLPRCRAPGHGRRHRARPDGAGHPRRG